MGLGFIFKNFPKKNYIANSINEEIFKWMKQGKELILESTTLWDYPKQNYGNDQRK